jgi:hypothetical protein
MKLLLTALSTAFLCLTLVGMMMIPYDAPTYAEVDSIPEADILDDLAEDTWAYLSSSWATANHLPYSWRSATIVGGDYANPTEMGLYALSWLLAFEREQLWSPNWAQTEAEVSAILAQLRAWQTGAQTQQPNGPNAYEDSVFYQWYHISQSPPVVGPEPEAQVVPALGNAWLAASLIVIRAYAQAESLPVLYQAADEILEDMDFRLWYYEDTHRFSWGDVQSPLGGGQATYYSNENRLINFVARALGHLTMEEFSASLDALERPPGTYSGITVERIAWSGAYANYAAPALFIDEVDTLYGANTISPATEAQIVYAEYEEYDAWGLSDSYDVGAGLYAEQGAPPVAMPGSPESRPGLITPQASALALITSWAPEALVNLQAISDGFSCAYDTSYGFHDSVMAKPSAPDYGQCSDRFSALAQLRTFLALGNYASGFVQKYLYQDAGIVCAHQEMFGEQPAPPDRHYLYLPTIRKAGARLVVADFDNCTSTNNLGGAMGAAYNLPDYLDEGFVPEAGRGCVAVMEYHISDWAAFWMKLLAADLSLYSELCFDIRSGLLGAPSEIKVELKRPGEIAIASVPNINTSWQTVCQPLSGFTPSLSSLRNMEELVFTFELGNAGSRGILYLDNVMVWQ